MREITALADSVEAEARRSIRRLCRGTTMERLLATLCLTLALSSPLAMIRTVGGGDLTSVASTGMKVNPMDFSSFSDSQPDRPVDLLFIHHSVGGRWLAEPVPVADGKSSILKIHPEGGGLRRALEEQGYRISEASYGSKIGQDTDVRDWPTKFRDQMEAILSCGGQDNALTQGRRNLVVVFKS